MIIDIDRVEDHLASIGLAAWCEPLRPVLADRTANTAHGDLPDWLDAIASLPDASLAGVTLDAPTVEARLDAHDTAALRGALQRLSPWRKGPFRIGGVDIDSEWRSDWKWQRLEDAIAPLEGRHVLDVGCGNGYYAWRMLGAGARSVTGVDPTLLFLAQFRALAAYLPADAICSLPLRLEELPEGQRSFDTVFSMGVLYHQRSPIDHLRSLKRHLRAGGELVLETIVLPGDAPLSRTPGDRYARMRNVWMLPTIAELTVWLERTRLTDIRLVDVTRTTIDEQRSTAWMRFESLAEALDPKDPTLTVEGWPAPHRAVVLARA